MREIMKWDYKNKGGQVAGHVIRLEAALEGSKSRKQVIPYFKENGQSGIPENMPKVNRIFGMDSISDFSKPIFIVEGEKCAYALQGLGFQAITSLGGCGQGNLAEWSVIDKAKCIYILPDNDSNGWKYASGIYSRLQLIMRKSEIKLLQFPLFDKSDICDYLKTIPELKNWNEFDSLGSVNKLLQYS